MPKLRCHCGRTIDVEISQAGQRIECECKRRVQVPGEKRLTKAEENGEAIELSNRDIEEGSSYEPIKAEAKAEATGRDFNLVLTGSDVFFERISQEALLHYISQIERAVKRVILPASKGEKLPNSSLLPSNEASASVQDDTKTDTSQDRQSEGNSASLTSLATRPKTLLQIAIALRSDQTPIIDIATFPENSVPDVVRELEHQIASVDAPPVQNGTLAFVLYRSINSDLVPKFHFRTPFYTKKIPAAIRWQLIDELNLANPKPDQKVRPFRKLAWRDQIFFDAKHWLRKLRKSKAQKSRSHMETVEDVSGNYSRDQLAELSQLERREVQGALKQYANNPALWHRLGDIEREAGNFTDAIAAYSMAIEFDPNNSLPLASRALAHCMDDSFQAGLSDCNQAIEMAPHDIGHRMIRAELYADLGAWTEGEQDLDRVIELEPWRPGVYIRRARFRLMREDRDGALEDLKSAIRLDPHSEDAFALRATILLRQPTPTQNDFRKAIADASKAIDLNAKVPAYFSLRGEAYALINKFALAIEDCDRAIELNDQSGFAYGVRGYAHQQLEQFEEAIRDCTKAIELSGGSPTIYISRAHANYALEQLEAAIDDCDLALEIDHENAPAYNLRGVIRMQMGDAENAMSDFAEAIRIAPDWASPYEHQAIVNRINSNDDDAIDNLSKSLELTPSNIRALINRAFAYIDRQEFTAALDDLNRAVELDGELSESYLYRGQLYIRLNDFDKARVDLDRAINLDSQLAEAYFSRGQLNLREKEYQAAVDDLNQLVELSQDQPAAYLARAHAWLQMGDQEKAETDFAKAVELDPDSAEVVSIQKLLAKSQFYDQRGEYDRAIELASEALELDAECYPAMLLRANSHWYAEQWVEAVDDYTRLLDAEDEAVPSRAMIYCNRGQVLAEMGEYERALSDLNRAITLSEKMHDETHLAFGLNGRALVMTGMEKFQDAENDFMRSLDLRPKNAWAHFNLALMYRQRGQLEKARKEMEVALESQDPPLSPRRRERAKAFLSSK